jgi:hypothetical protein
MAATPNVKFMGRPGGVVHVVTTKRNDLKTSKCNALKKGHEDGVWKGKGVSPDAALSLKGCSKCRTHEVAESARKERMTPAQRRAESKAKRDETMDKMRDGKKPKGEPKRRGPRGNRAETMMAKAQGHADFAEQQGWSSRIEETGDNELTVFAEKSKQVLRLIYRDGRIVLSRVVLANGVEVRLRNSSNWKQHAEGKSKYKDDYRPKANNAGKRSARKEVIDDAAERRLPFDLIEDDDDVVIESLIGKQITWRNGTSNALDSAVLPSRVRNCRITTHPKSGRRMISFHEHQGQSDEREVLGGERTVYLDKILRVKG